LIDQLNDNDDIIGKTMGLLQKVVAKNNVLKEKVAESILPSIIRFLENEDFISSNEAARALVVLLQTLTHQCTQNVNAFGNAGIHTKLRFW
jgi:hypothetical protein